MTDKEIKALERLTPKLSALRKTLRGEERKQLDRLVLAAQAEVQPHSAHTRMSVTGSKTDQKIPEVSMHSVNIRSKDVGQKILSAEGQKSVGQKIPSAEARSSVARIELDSKSSVYRVTIL
jgi:hypothetical protein